MPVDHPYPTLHRHHRARVPAPIQRAPDLHRPDRRRTGLGIVEHPMVSALAGLDRRHIHVEAFRQLTQHLRVRLRRTACGVHVPRARSPRPREAGFEVHRPVRTVVRAYALLVHQRSVVPLFGVWKDGKGKCAKNSQRCSVDPRTRLSTARLTFIRSRK